MANFTAAQKRRDELAQAVQQNEIALNVAQAQYVQGASDFLNVLSAQNALLASQSALVEATAHVAGSVTQLYRAIGGGWETLYLMPKNPPNMCENTP